LAITLGVKGFLLAVLVCTAVLAVDAPPIPSTGTVLNTNTATFKELTDYGLSYRNGAEGGDAQSEYNLGAAYRWGVGVEHNLIKAVQWIQKSASQGYPPAERVLSEMYAKGEGVPQSNVEAFRWCRQAALQKDPLAEEALAGLRAKLTPEELLSLTHRGAANP
jgi:hypothetical protein